MSLSYKDAEGANPLVSEEYLRFFTAVCTALKPEAAPSAAEQVEVLQMYLFGDNVEDTVNRVRQIRGDPDAVW